MRISRDFKSVQETSTFSPGKRTFQYFVVPLQTVSMGRQNHVCLLIQQLSAKSHFTAQKMPRPPESLKSKSCQRKLVINLPHLCKEVVISVERNEVEVGTLIAAGHDCLIQ